MTLTTRLSTAFTAVLLALATVVAAAPAADAAPPPGRGGTAVAPNGVNWN